VVVPVNLIIGTVTAAPETIPTSSPAAPATPAEPVVNDDGAVTDEISTPVRVVIVPVAQVAAAQPAATPVLLAANLAFSPTAAAAPASATPSTASSAAPLRVSNITPASANVVTPAPSPQATGRLADVTATPALRADNATGILLSAPAPATLAASDPRAPSTLVLPAVGADGALTLSVPVQAINLAVFTVPQDAVAIRTAMPMIDAAAPAEGDAIVAVAAAGLFLDANAALAEPGSDGLALPGLQACDLATGAAPFTPLLMEQALQQFVQRLSSLQEVFRGWLMAYGPWPWICLGLAAAAVTSELARRVQQLRWQGAIVQDEQALPWFPGLYGPEE
jgi:hypothetical protein